MFTKRIMNKVFSISLTLCMFASSYTFAAPNITGISGTISHGSTVTISGSGFGNKNPAKPIIWADFEDGNINPGPLGQRNSWDESANLDITDLNQDTNSNYNAVGEWFVSGGWGSQGYKASFSFLIEKGQAQGYWTKIYHYQKRYFDFDITANQKYWRLWPKSPNRNDFLAAWQNGSGRCYNEKEGYAGGVIGSYQGSPPTKNQWHIEEFIWQHSGGTGKNTDGSSTRWVDPTDHSEGYYSGVWDYTRNGVQNQHRENVNNREAVHKELRTDNFTDSAHVPPDGSKVYMDNIYIDDTYARVMIADKNTFSGSAREIQIPTVWSDSSITIHVNQGSFIDGADVYLYVIDSNNNVSNGFLIGVTQGDTLIGGTQGDTPPSPPQGVIKQ